MTSTLLAGLLLLTAACEERAAPAPKPAQPAAVAPARAPAGAPAPAKAAPAATLALDGEGLRIVETASGSTRLLPFEAPAEQVLAALARLGRGEPERSSNDECGAGTLVFAGWPDGLQVSLQEDRFVGWFLGEAAPGLATMSGVRVGSTRAELEAAYAAEIAESTLGTEFNAGGLGGLLSGPGKDARITDLWAGTNCFFR